MRTREESTWADFAFCALLVLLGAAFLWNARHWAAAVYVGGDQFGDAQFWWDGALHFAQGIVAGNPNLLYRMGYAAFAGAASAVLGSDFLVFHKLLLALFLLVAAALYCRLRVGIGRIAAGAATALFVFNPYTAEWLAISSSDSLGLILNLGAMLTLDRGLRPGIQSRARLGALAAAGTLLAAASLTRPLMTLMALPAALAVWAAAGWRVKRAAPGWAALAAPFLALTFSWMGLMAVLSGNFAISGASQDASIFYAASDPHIQVWTPAMYPRVENAARARAPDHVLTPARVSHEFWAETSANYRRHWRYHLGRLGPHLAAVAALTPLRATAGTPASAALRRDLQLAFALLLAGAAAARRRWPGAAAALLLGAAWAWWPPFHLWVLLLCATAGLAAILTRHLTCFLWASYWWVGAAALYLTGGTFGPPLSGAVDVNALGYRLGLQFFFAGDILVAAGIAYAAGFRPRSGEEPAAADAARPPAGRALVLAARLGVAALGLLLLLGSAKVGWRMAERARTRPLAYPDLSVLARDWAKSRATPAIAVARNPVEFNAAIAAADGGRFFTGAMSSGFVWNLPGQDRCLLLLYQEEDVRPIRMAPYYQLAEVPTHVPAGPWRLRQGAWLLRPFADLPVRSNQAYFIEVTAIQAFVPLAADGRSYETGRAVVFPLAKYASQLAADGELAIAGAGPVWAADSGGEKFPRRVGLRPTGPGGPVTLNLDLRRARGRRRLHFGWRIEGSSPSDRAPALELSPASAQAKGAIWTSGAAEASPAIRWADLPLPDVPAVRLSARPLPGSATLWLYEFTLTADDYLR